MNVLLEKDRGIIWSDSVKMKECTELKGERNTLHMYKRRRKPDCAVTACVETGS